VLKAAKFLKRDPRAKERKKPGLKKARKAPQWSKR
jgi:small subunit ribosomal protein S9